MIYIENLSQIFYRKNLLTGEVVGPMKKEVFLAQIKEEMRKEPLSYWFNMEKIDYRPSDKWNYTGSAPVEKYILRDTESFYCYYIVYLDGYGRIIDPRTYMKEALNCSNSRALYGCHIYARYHKDNNYKYRNGPVPYTRKKKGGPSCSKKCRGIKRIFKYYTDPEYGNYVRNKAIPFRKEDWWDIYVPYKPHDSWKNHKKRKQWM